MLFSNPTTAASATDACPKPAKTDDPFADLDDLLTEEEKREALHKDLDRKLAQHKARCEKMRQQQNATSSKKQQAAQGDNTASSGVEQSQTAGSQGQAAVTSNTPQQQHSTVDATQEQPKGSGQYSSPWSTQNPSSDQAGKVMLEPMAKPPANEPDTAPPPVAGSIAQTPTSKAGETDQPKQKESLFLKTYGGQSTLDSEKIEDIADRHKTARRYGSPGNTGTNQQNPNYSDPGKKVGQTTTVSADDAVIAALKQRLKNETDPEKRKEIQAEIDKYQKK